MAGKGERKTHANEKEGYIHVKVQPRSSQNCISEIMADGTIKVKLTAPPVEGKANECLLEFLASVLEIRKSDLTIKSGQTARIKTIQVIGRSQESIDMPLRAALKV